MAEAIAMQEVETRTYDVPEYRRFVRDMSKAGIDVIHYRGRFSYEGPAVVTGEEFSHSDVKAATKVLLQHDQMGKGEVLYPR
jgi:hypothetical protein